MQAALKIDHFMWNHFMYSALLWDVSKQWQILNSFDIPVPFISMSLTSYCLLQLGFEINCGADNNCVDNLKVDFNFTK